MLVASWYGELLHLFLKHTYKLIFGLFQFTAVIILIEAQISPSLTREKLLKFTPESF
jgi:hypothetical protein